MSNSQDRAGQARSLSGADQQSEKLNRQFVAEKPGHQQPERVEVCGEYVFFYCPPHKYSGVLSRGNLKKDSVKKEY